MCWSFEVSLLSGMFSYIVATYLWIRNYKNDRMFSIGIFTFSSIQWCDALLWHDLKSRNDSELNRTITNYIIPFIFSIEAISLIYGAHIIGKSIPKSELIVYIIWSIFMFSTHLNNNKTTDNNGLNYGYKAENTISKIIIRIVFFNINI